MGGQAREYFRAEHSAGGAADDRRDNRNEAKRDTSKQKMGGEANARQHRHRGQ